MQTVETQRLHADTQGIARAATLLRAGALVAFGTETVYGLGADATDPRAVNAVFAAKQRPRHNPLIIHLADADAAFREVRESDLARAFAARFWPGPLTLVLPRLPASRVCPGAAAGLDTLAVRVPAGDAARRLLHETDRPVAAPSANRSGRISPTLAAHVLDGLGGRIDAVLDCGPCVVGLESTVLALDDDGATLLRPGGIATEAIASLLAEYGAPPLLAALPHDPPRGPGQLAAHYAPSLPVRLDADTAHDDEALLAFGPAPDHAGPIWNLSPSCDLTEAAQRLFAGLRALDTQASALSLAGIAAMPIPAHGLGLAIRDRLARAAAATQ
ncbi:L-threonylcarbamoyladenylate synthase [Lichenicoccus sp.]|uniref:L-threonylcarbamoyladenylate synthase n=1 Tax=Lichenicoccus sp. TaxID=2781899 RepID=UPI003D09E060